MSPEAYLLNIYTSPKGAIVREDGGTLAGRDGFIALRYKTDSLKQHQENGCFLINGFTATWPSGAKASSGVIRWCDKDKTLMGVMIRRPADAPNLQFDLDAERRMLDEAVAASNAAAAQVQPPSTEQLIATGGSNKYDTYYSADAGDINLSSDCDTAEKEAAAKVNSMAAASKGLPPNVCQSARNSRRSGEIGLKLAEACEGRPGNDELVSAMVKLIKESDATIQGSCM